MSVKIIDGHLLRKMIVAGANKLNKHKQIINELNVFPVPDGDTGSNMYLTIETTAKEVLKLNTPNANEVAKVASSASLRGARGNSGVILSQLFRGFHKGLDGNSLITTKILANAFSKATEVAYKAVMKPREGTILTIAAAISTKAEEMSEITDDIEVMMSEVLKHAHITLIKTTDMLPELKAANVVDSGGKGLIYIIEGAVHSIHEEDVVLDTYEHDSNEHTSLQSYAATGEIDIKFAYCTEFFINVTHGSEKLENDVKNFLDANGDSIVAVWDDDIIKVHVHTNNPGKVLEYAIKSGSISNIKIENMKIQHTNIINFAKESDKQLSKANEIEICTEKKAIGILSISTGKGLSELFTGLGVDQVVEGGQSMNPSTEDLLNAIDKINADDIIILPNNKNIILVAEQAGKVSNKAVHVVNSKTVPEGIGAIMGYIPDVEINVNLEQMKQVMSLIKTAQITYAVRDTIVNDKKIVKGNIIGIINDEIEVVSQNNKDCVIDVIQSMIDETTDIVTIYYGEDITSLEVYELEECLKKTYENLDIEIVNGGQSVYFYIISTE
jgi:uncharacterized protein